MTSDERIAQLEAENESLRLKLATLENIGKSIRHDPLSEDKIAQDFNLSRGARSARDKLTWLTILILFAETEYQSNPYISSSNRCRIRLNQMSDAQYNLYCETVDKIYSVLLKARNKSLSQHLNVWDLNSPNVPSRIISTLEQLPCEYIHKGDKVPKANNI